MFPFDPCYEDISLDDVAHSLSGINRFAGHNSAVWYSVAEHSILVSFIVPEKDAKWALLHDASEGLGLSDLPSPVKRFLPEYKRAEAVMMNAVCRRFELSSEEPESVKLADAALLSKEQLTFQPNVSWLREAIAARKHEPLTDLKLYGWDPIMAKKKFLDRCFALDIR